MNDSSLTRRVGISSLWTVGTRITVQLISLVSMVLLARWIGPAQMGLFEKVAIILGLLDMLSALGLETALIQRKTLAREHYDTAWTLNIARGAAMAVVLVLLSYKADSWFHAPGMGAILPWVALMPLIQGFENTGMVDVRRNYNFSIDFQWVVGKRIASFVFTLGLAWQMKSVWALAYGSLASTLVGVALSYILTAYRPQLSLAGWADLRKFVGWFFSYTTIAAVSGRVDDLLLLRLATPADTAFYRRAGEFSGLPTTELAGPMSRALLPGLAKLADHPVERRELFTQFLALSMVISFPACIGLGFLAHPFTILLLGDKWAAVVPLLQIMCFSGIFRVYGSLAEVGFIATNRVDLAVRLTIITLR
jgi:lipopolysaccharide exporter